MANGERALAIGVVSFERGQLTKRCIDSIRDVASVPYLIVLADNNSRDPDTTALLSQWRDQSDIVVHRSAENFGPSHGRNRILDRLSAIDRKRYDYGAVAMLDNDVVALEGWDRAALDALDAGADLIQPKLLRPDRVTVDRGPNSENADPLSIHPKYVGLGAKATAPEVNAPQGVLIVGCATIARRTVYDRIGGYDERLYTSEDYDLSFRAKAAGFSLRYAPTCVLIHDHVFDIAYDQQRSDLYRLLSSHVRLWDRYNKAVYSPQYLGWFRWLYEHNEPMYLERKQGAAHLLRRIKRRLVRQWYFSRHPRTWGSVREAERASRSLSTRLDSELSNVGA